MEEISLFVSICWPSLRTRILYFGKQGVTPYHHVAIKLANSFDGFYISHVSPLLNIKADVLAALAATLALPADTLIILRWLLIMSSVRSTV